MRIKLRYFKIKGRNIVASNQQAEVSLVQRNMSVEKCKKTFNTPWPIHSQILHKTRPVKVNIAFVF